MTLSEFIRERFSGSQRRFAREAHVDAGQLSRYLKLERGEAGGSKPGADAIARIEKATAGAISASHWAELTRFAAPDSHPA